MKKSLFLLFAVLGVLINSCREDGKWNDNDPEGFGYSIERDTDFIEKAVGESNILKFNIKTKYNFVSVPIKIKYTSSLKGILKLGDRDLEPNKEYELKEENNNLEYVGQVAGEHLLKITVQNEKGVTVVEDFALKYAVSDFSIEIKNTRNEVYQGEEAQYILKVSPLNSTDNTGYEIRFDSYDNHQSSKVKYDGNVIDYGKFYKISEAALHNISLGLSSWTAGDQKLLFTIRNKTVTKTGIEISQKVLPRTVKIVNMKPSEEKVGLNKFISINGFVSKDPFKDNNTIYYKTWISSSDPDAITNTQNQWTKYILGDSNSVNLKNLKTNTYGTHKYNIQFKDEFGNESEIKTFDIEVNEDITWVKNPTVFINIEQRKKQFGTSPLSYYTEVYYKGINLDFIAKTGLGNKIIKYKINISFHFDGQYHPRSYEVALDNFTDNLEINRSFNVEERLYNKYLGTPPYAGDGTYTLIVYDSQGKEKSINGKAQINHSGY